jgi:hypothetical protein
MAVLTRVSRSPALCQDISKNNFDGAEKTCSGQIDKRCRKIRIPDDSLRIDLQP